MDARKGIYFVSDVHLGLEVGDPATNCVNFPEIYKNASLAGMKYQVVEQEDFTEGLDPFESVKRSCDYVKTMRPE